MNKHKIGEIEFSKGGLGMVSSSPFPRYFKSVWWVSIPILESEKKKGHYTTGIGLENKGDAEAFSEFLKVHLKKYIKEKIRKTGGRSK